MAEDVDLCFRRRRDKRKEWKTDEDLLGVNLVELSSSESDREPLTTERERDREYKCKFLIFFYKFWSAKFLI